MVKAVVGANWGDEGKGKITDMLGKEADIIVRFQGGANAGHTIVNDLKPVSERGYVHLNKAASDTADTEEEPSQETQATDTESEE